MHSVVQQEFNNKEPTQSELNDYFNNRIQRQGTQSFDRSINMPVIKGGQLNMEKRSHSPDSYFEKVKSIYQPVNAKSRLRKKQNEFSRSIDNGSAQRRKQQIYQSLDEEGVSLARNSSGHKRYANLQEHHQHRVKQKTLQSQNSHENTGIGGVRSGKPFFLNKVERERKFQNQFQNDRMVKRLNQIKARKNKYLKDAEKSIKFQKEHKLIHQSTVLAHRKLKEIEREEKNDKFVDRLIERTKYKQSIKPNAIQKVAKCVKLDESRARVIAGAKDVRLPAMDLS